MNVSMYIIFYALPVSFTDSVSSRLVLLVASLDLSYLRRQLFFFFKSFQVVEAVSDDPLTCFFMLLGLVLGLVHWVTMKVTYKVDLKSVALHPLQHLKVVGLVLE